MLSRLCRPALSNGLNTNGWDAFAADGAHRQHIGFLKNNNKYINELLMEIPAYHTGIKGSS